MHTKKSAGNKATSKWSHCALQQPQELLRFQGHYVLCILLVRREDVCLWKANGQLNLSWYSLLCWTKSTYMLNIIIVTVLLKELVPPLFLIAGQLQYSILSHYNHEHRVYFRCTAEWTCAMLCSPSHSQRCDTKTTPHAMENYCMVTETSPSGLPLKLIWQNYSKQLLFTYSHSTATIIIHLKSCLWFPDAWSRIITLF